MIKIEVDQESLKYVQARLGTMQNKAPQVISAALNETARSARVKLSDGARSKYIVKSGGVKSSMKIRRATYGRLEAEVISQGSPVKIEKFKVTAPASGAKAQVLKSGGLKSLIKGNLKAFAAGMTRGHPGNVHNGIYQRKGKSRLPIKSFYGPSAAKMVEKVYGGGDGAGIALKPKIESVLQKNIERQIRRLTS